MTREEAITFAKHTSGHSEVSQEHIECNLTTCDCSLCYWRRAHINKLMKISVKDKITELQARIVGGQDPKGKLVHQIRLLRTFDGGPAKYYADKRKDAEKYATLLREAEDAEPQNQLLIYRLKQQLEAARYVGD